MLTKDDNELITQVGPGTPMGNMMRQYWFPAMLASEVTADGDPVHVTGGQPIPGAGVVDFAAFAKAAGFPHTYCFDDAAVMQAQIGDALRREGPVFITLKVLPATTRGGMPRKPTKQAIRDVMAAIRPAAAVA